MTKNKYKFLLRRSGNLTDEEKTGMMKLAIATYPKFKKYYLKNKYFSVVRPQMINLIKDDDKVVGTGKFMWRKIKVGKMSVKMFAFGVLIAKEYQNQGLGSQLIKRNIVVAKKMGADVLYGSTVNPIAEKIVEKLKFKMLSVPVLYKNIETGKEEIEKGRVWAYECKKGVLKDIEKSTSLYIGRGQL